MINIQSVLDTMLEIKEKIHIIQNGCIRPEEYVPEEADFMIALVEELKALSKSLETLYDKIYEYCCVYEVTPTDSLVKDLSAMQNWVAEFQPDLQHIEPGTEQIVISNVSDGIDKLRIYWQEKYTEHFFDWAITLEYQNRMHLTEHYSMHRSSQAALAASQSNARKAQELYYDPRRNHNEDLPPLQQTFFSRRATKGKQEPIDIHQYSARTIISAEVEALRLAIENADPQLLAQMNLIKEATQGRMSGGSGNHVRILRGRASSSSENVQAVCYQNKPVPGQLGNLFTSGVGEYGAAKGKSGKINILALLNQITQSDPEKEQLLAQQLLLFKAYGDAQLSHEVLADLGMPINQQQAEKLLKAAHLILMQEVIRRENAGSYFSPAKDGTLITSPDLPFSAAINLSLHLIASGHLNMKQVFDKDAEYGVCTGEGIMRKNLPDTLLKFERLFEKATEVLKEDSMEVVNYEELSGHSGSHMSVRMEGFHSLHQMSDGGDEDSDQEDYNANDDGYGPSVPY